MRITLREAWFGYAIKKHSYKTQVEHIKKRINDPFINEEHRSDLDRKLQHVQHQYRCYHQKEQEIRLMLRRLGAEPRAT